MVVISYKAVKPIWNKVLKNITEMLTCLERQTDSEQLHFCI
jgi:hypothetical protein